MTLEPYLFARPESYTVSVRLNAEESRVLTEAARFYHMKLSTYIKQQALVAARLPLVCIEQATRARA